MVVRRSCQSAGGGLSHPAVTVIIGQHMDLYFGAFAPPRVFQN
jgi:hypothetical protein